jgi:four helix bundle protein
VRVFPACRCAAALPPEERLDLGRQIRRAAVSVPSNIAEGYGRRGSRDTARFLTVAAASARELETQLLLCERLRRIESRATDEAPRACDEVARMLTALMRRLRLRR